MCDAMEERTQPADTTFWKDILIYRSRDVPWKLKNVKDWWIMSMLSLRWGVKTGRGPCRQWKRSKDGKPKQRRDCSVANDKKK